MKGKIIAWIIVGFIGIPLLLFFGIALILFLAPGVEIFGVRYVARGIVDFKKEESVDNFNGDIYINSFDVPVELVYSAMPGIHVSFRQEYVGFTRTKAKQPSLSFKVEHDGNINISTTEIQKFIFASELNDAYYLTIRLPNNTKNIYVNSETSSVKLSGAEGVTPRLEIATEGKLSVANKMTIETLKFTTNSDVELGKNINLTNATIKTGNRYINIANGVTGDLNLTNTSGKIAFNECNNITVNTSSGVVKSSTSKGAVVNGLANITTKSGSVSIDKILGTAERSTITTKTGQIDINYVNDITIISNRGIVDLGQTRDLKIHGGAGEIKVDGVLDKAIIDSTNGKVTLGSENGATINNPTVTTTTGKIYVYNTFGAVSLTSQNNLVYVKNSKGLGATKFKLSAGRELTALNLEGEVNAYANGDVYMKFQSLTKDVTVSVGTKCRAVTIDAKCKMYNEVNYVLKSSKNKTASVYAGNQLLTKSNPISSTILVAAPKITVTGAYQVTTLYLGDE